MKIVSWNVNGLAACKRKGFLKVLPDKPTVQVVRLASAEIISHKPVRTSFHPYLDQEYAVWLQQQRDTQKVSGPKRRGIWNRQGGRCYYCGAPMLPDQELELVEITFGMMPKLASHAKVYANFMDFAVKAYAAWASDVRTGAYPEDKHGWHMDPVELEKFMEVIEKF